MKAIGIAGYLGAKLHGFSFCYSIPIKTGASPFKGMYW
jgi:hypothetical protein